MGNGISRRSGIFYGWIIVAVAAVGTCTGFGIIYSFSVFFRTWIDEFGSSRAVLSGIFSVAFIIYGLASIAMGWFSDRYGPRKVIAIGGTIMAAGCMLTAFCHHTGVLYLTWGLAVGIGVGTCYAPTAATVGKWFVHRKGMAMGILVSGLGMGTLVFSPLSERLIQSFGWRVAIFILGVIALTVFITEALVIRGNPRDMGLEPLTAPRRNGGNAHPDKARTIHVPDHSMTVAEALKTRNMWFIFAIHGLWMIGVGIVMAHFVPYATDARTNVNTAAAMMGSVGAMSVIGRFSLGVLTERWGIKRSFIIILSCQCLAMLLPFLGSSQWQLWMFVVVFGFGYGGLASIFPLAHAELFGLKAMGSLFGISLLGATIGGSTGPLIAGFSFDITHSYFTAFAVAAISIGISILLATGIKKKA
jgi:MFS family permease